MLLVFSGLFLAFPIPLLYAEGTGFKTPYSFREHLSEANVMILQETSLEGAMSKSQVKGVNGKWDNSRFIFPNLENEHAIFASQFPYEEIEKHGIFFHPSLRGVKVLQFYDVPAGAQLIVRYGIDDEGVMALRGKAMVYLSIWFGEHKIARLNIPNEKGWKKAVFDLGVVAFLKQPLVVTFGVTSDNVQSRRFNFDAEIQS